MKSIFLKFSISIEISLLFIGKILIILQLKFIASSRSFKFLIPGIQNLKDLEEAINLNCNIIKIYPIQSKDSSIDILNFKNIDFIAAGGLSINDVKTYKTLGYKAIVIGDKGIINKKFDPKICEWLKNN